MEGLVHRNTIRAGPASGTKHSQLGKDAAKKKTDEEGGEVSRYDTSIENKGMWRVNQIHLVQI